MGFSRMALESSYSSQIESRTGAGWDSHVGCVVETRYRPDSRRQVTNPESRLGFTWPIHVYHRNRYHYYNLILVYVPGIRHN